MLNLQKLFICNKYLIKHVLHLLFFTSTEFFTILTQFDVVQGGLKLICRGTLHKNFQPGLNLTLRDYMLKRVESLTLPLF